MTNMKKALAAMDKGREKTVQPKNEEEAEKLKDLLPRSVETADDIDELLEALAPTGCKCGAAEPCDKYGCGPLVPLPPSRAYTQAERDAHGLQHPERDHYEGPEGHWSENSAFYKCYHTLACPAHEPHDVFELAGRGGLTYDEAAAERDARRAIADTVMSISAGEGFLHDPARYFRVLDTLRKAASPS